jgi:hypothetical protein
MFKNTKHRVSAKRFAFLGGSKMGNWAMKMILCISTVSIKLFENISGFSKRVWMDEVNLLIIL